MKKRQYSILAALLGSLFCILLSSCASTPATKESRITANPDLYKKLKPNEQKAVQKGELIKGMSKDAVYLTMGSPSKQIEGYADGASFDRWSYNALKPRLRTGLSSHYGWGNRYGFDHRCGRFGFNYHGIGISHGVSYVPTNYATVTFKNDRVSSWSRSR